MNAIFSFPRFENYIKRNLIFSKSQYLYIIGIVAGAYLFALLFYMLTGMAMAWIIKFLILASIAIGSSIFEPTISKYNGVMEYTFPVSSFERFLSLWVRYVLIIPAITLGLYYLLNLVAGVLPVESLSTFTRKMAFTDISYAKIHALLGVQSIYLLGYLSFQRNSFLKTTFTCLLIMIVIMTVGLIFSKLFFNDVMMGSNYEMGEQMGEFARKMMSLDESDIQVPLRLNEYFFQFLFPVGMWIVCFFRIREREI